MNTEKSPQKEITKRRYGNIILWSLGITSLYFGLRDIYRGDLFLGVLFILCAPTAPIALYRRNGPSIALISLGVFLGGLSHFNFIAQNDLPLIKALLMTIGLVIMLGGIAYLIYSEVRGVVLDECRQG